MGISRAERAHTLALVARMPADEEWRQPQPAVFPRGADDHALFIPAPLTTEAWRGLLTPNRDEDLVTVLCSDRAATLVAAGLTSTDQSIRDLAGRSGGVESCR